jgi:hypothetical protein
MQYIIPLTAESQTFSIVLNGTEYRMTVRWSDVPEGGWLLDLADIDGQALIKGIPMVCGVDLLAPYTNLGIGGMLWMYSTDDTDPDFDGLGSKTELIFETEDN